MTKKITKPCKCGNEMILTDTGLVIDTLPALYVQVWLCKCGHREEGPNRIEDD